MQGEEIRTWQMVIPYTFHPKDYRKRTKHRAGNLAYKMRKEAAFSERKERCELFYGDFRRVIS
jgi:hypothetical protein